MSCREEVPKFSTEPALRPYQTVKSLAINWPLLLITADFSRLKLKLIFVMANPITGRSIVATLRRSSPSFDFVHAAEHVHQAARALGEDGERWVTCCRQGQVSQVLTEMTECLNRLTPPPDPSVEQEHPWCVLHRELGYLKNNQERMDYPRYRCEGLPLTSSPIES